MNKGSLFNNENIEDPEDTFEVTQFLEERTGYESNLEEENMYDAIITITAHYIFQKRLTYSILK